MNQVDLHYAAFHQRLGAYLIDVLACLFLSIIFFFAVVRPIMVTLLIPEVPQPSEDWDPHVVWLAMEAWQKALVFLLFLASAWVPGGLYYALLESSSRRATLGKMALKLVTVRMDGSRISFLRASARFFIKVFICCVPFGFIAILPIYGARRQGAHDWMTGVVVAARANVI